MKSIIRAAAVVGVAATLLPASAWASVSLRINPAKPIVDDNVSVSFKVVKPLKSGFHYSVTLLGAGDGECAQLVEKSSKRNPAKGKTMTFNLKPSDDKTFGGDEWCQGKAIVSVQRERNGSESGGTLVGIKEIRFSAKP